MEMELLARISTKMELLEIFRNFLSANLYTSTTWSFFDFNICTLPSNLRMFICLGIGALRWSRTLAVHFARPKLLSFYGNLFMVLSVIWKLHQHLSC